MIPRNGGIGLNKENIDIKIKRPQLLSNTIPQDQTFLNYVPNQTRFEIT